MSVEIYRMGLKNSQYKEVSTNELFENADHGIYVAKSCNSRNQLTNGDKMYLWAVYVAALRDNPQILRRYNPEAFIPETLKSIKGKMSSKDKRFFNLVDSKNAKLVRVVYIFNKRKLEKATFVFQNSNEENFEYNITGISPFMGNISSYLFR